MSQVLAKHDNRVIALLGKVDALTSKVSALTSKIDDLPPKFDALGTKVANVSTMTEKSLGCLKSTSSRLNNIFKWIQENPSGSKAQQLQATGQELGC